MGLSSKQVSSNGHDWNQKLLHASDTLELPKPSMKRQNQQQQQQQQQQQLEPLKCPRCDSTNTKFCYYNNYNKSQPRHFCKTCKRHWTKGGTLRNVPVGGGRKNKRLKTTTTTTTATKSTTYGGKSSISDSSNDHMPTQSQKQRLDHFPLPLGDEKTLSDTLIKQPPSSIQDCLFSSSSLNFNGRNLCSNNSIFMGSALSLPLNQDLQYPYLSLTSFESNPSSISTSMQCSNLYTSTGDQANSLEDTIMACLDTTVSSSSTSDLAWINPNTSSVAMDMPINLGWEEFEKLVSADLTTPWDDAELKP